MANVNVAFGKPINTAVAHQLLKVLIHTSLATAQRDFQGSMVRLITVVASLFVLLPEILRLPLVFLLAVNMYLPLQARKCFQIFGPVQVQTNSTLSVLCMTTRCSGSLFVQTLRLPMRRLLVPLFLRTLNSIVVQAATQPQCF